MAELENEHMKKVMKKQDEKYKKYLQIVSKNEAESLRKTLETRTKERDSLKEEIERHKQSAQRQLQHIKELIGETSMLKKQLTSLENNYDDVPNFTNTQAEIEHQVNLIKQQYQNA